METECIAGKVVITFIREIRLIFESLHWLQRDYGLVPLGEYEKPVNGAQRTPHRSLSVLDRDFRLSQIDAEKIAHCGL
jgi:hypothetical protein